jgi:hypothetical protein
MALLDATELSTLRDRHERAVLGGLDTPSAAGAAHHDRERLLDLAERLVPVADAARIALGLIQRGTLPPAARSALLELHLALGALAQAEPETFDAEAEAFDDDAEVDGDVRLSA